MNTSVVTAGLHRVFGARLTAEYGAKASGHNTGPFGCIRLTALWDVSTQQVNQ